MRTQEILRSAMLLVVLSGCSNIGVLYSEYQQFSLASARIKPEETSPVHVNIGWDQGSLAIVRRRGDKDGSSIPQAGEAVSMIAKSEVGSEFSLGDSSDKKKLLGADSYFIAGTAAIVAAVEENKKVSIVSGNQDQPAVTGFTTEGSPAERIGAALGARIEALETLRKRIADEQDVVAGLLDTLDSSKYNSARAALIASGLAQADDEYDAGNMLSWLRKFAKGEDTEEGLRKLRAFRHALEAL